MSAVTGPLTPADRPPDAEPEQDQQIRQTVDQWFPLTPEQREKLSLLLHPGARDGAA